MRRDDRMARLPPSPASEAHFPTQAILTRSEDERYSRFWMEAAVNAPFLSALAPRDRA
jgi:hypothetical protein